MTRFARAKGSKSSNERIPNDATPWHVMKQQLTDNLSKKQESLERAKSAKELLADRQDTIRNSNTKNVDNSWAEFPTDSGKKSNDATSKIKKKQKKEQLNSMQEDQHTSKKKSSLKRNIDEVDNSVTEIKQKKRKKDKNQSDPTNNVSDATVEKLNKKRKKDKHNDSQVEENKSNLSNGTSEPKVEKLNKKRKKDKHNSSQIKEDKSNLSNDTSETQNGQDTFSKSQKHNKKKRKSLNENVSNASENINNNNNNNNNDGGNYRRDNQGARFNKNFVNRSENFSNSPNQFGARKFDMQKKKRKAPKIRDDKEHKRRKPDLGSSKMMINGMEIEIVKFDGFPIKKEDADRLKDLKQKMIMKGIPQKEIATAMKLERRKAEKALARIKKSVCFHCRKGGHNLSDCPELGLEQTGTGICFKCGSTEHTYFECKVAKPTEFRYATCFICREQGHIAKQCPDNPKGVYPQGGACKICGDVTHLKKDCPDLIKEKEESTVTVNTITNGNLESLEGNKNSASEKEDKKAKKIVTF